MYKPGKEQIESFDTYQATYYYDNYNYVSQRPLNKKHVNYLCNEIITGRFRKNTTIAICTTPDDKKHVVNGQHTLKAIAQSEHTIVLRIENYDCDTMEDVATVFATYDRGRPRLSSDIYHAYGVADNFHITPTQGGFMCCSIMYLAQDVSKIEPKRKLAPQEIINFAESLAWRFKKYIVATEGTTQSTGKFRAPVLALALITQKHPEAFDFWNGFVNDDGLGKFDPRKHFLEVNKKISLTTGAKQGNKATLGSMALFKIGAYCWNHYVGGKKLKILNIDLAQNTTTGVAETAYRTGFGQAEFMKLLKEAP